MPQDPNRFISKCRLCGTQFTIPSLSIPVIGKSTDERIAALIKGPLQSHLAGKHANLLAPMVFNMQTFYGMEVLGTFEHEDPVLLSKIDEARKAIHHRTLGPKVTDAQIRDLAARLYFDEDKCEKIVRLCRGLIEYVCELRPDQQAPAEPSALVTPNGSPLTQ